MKAKRFNLIIIGFSIAFLLLYIYKEDGIENLVSSLSNLNILWISGAVCLMIVYWILESLILHIAIKKFHFKQRFVTTLQTSMIGQFFNCITPFSSGGQPMQAYHMVKTGVPLGTASCSLLLKFIVYQFVLTIYSAITLIFHFSNFIGKVSGLGILILVGFSLNTVVIFALLSICFFSNQTKSFIEFIVKIGSKVHLIKNPDSVRTYLLSELDSFYDGFLVMRKNPFLIIKMGMFSIIQLTSYFLIPYFLYRAFHLSGNTITTMIAAEAFVLNITSFVPLPGAAGGAEFSFHNMFGMFFPQNFLNPAILLWRVVTFYLTILVGMCFTIHFTKSIQSIETNKNSRVQTCIDQCIHKSIKKPNNS